MTSVLSESKDVSDILSISEALDLDEDIDLNIIDSLVIRRPFSNSPFNFN